MEQNKWMHCRHMASYTQVKRLCQKDNMQSTYASIRGDLPTPRATEAHTSQTPSGRVRSETHHKVRNFGPLSTTVLPRNFLAQQGHHNLRARHVGLTDKSATRLTTSSKPRTFRRLKAHAKTLWLNNKSLKQESRSPSLNLGVGSPRQPTWLGESPRPPPFFVGTNVNSRNTGYNYHGTWKRRQVWCQNNHQR